MSTVQSFKTSECPFTGFDLSIDSLRLTFSVSELSMTWRERQLLYASLAYDWTLEQFHKSAFSDEIAPANRCDIDSPTRHSRITDFKYRTARTKWNKKNVFSWMCVRQLCANFLDTALFVRHSNALCRLSKTCRRKKGKNKAETKHTYRHGIVVSEEHCFTRISAQHVFRSVFISCDNDGDQHPMFNWIYCWNEVVSGGRAKRKKFITALAITIKLTINCRMKEIILRVSLLSHSSIRSFFWSSSSSPASLSVPRQAIPHMACITTSSRTLFGRNILGWCWLKLVCRWPLNCSSSRLSFALVSPLENVYFRAFRANEHRVCCGNMTIATCTFVHSFEHFFLFVHFCIRHNADAHSWLAKAHAFVSIYWSIWSVIR